LLAEAVGEGREGILAVCLVVRNRCKVGLPLGLSGARKPNLEAFVRKCGVSWELVAKDIVKKVFNDNCPDITNGALYFRRPNERMFRWCKIETFRYNNHIFYK